MVQITCMLGIWLTMNGIYWWPFAYEGVSLFVRVGENYGTVYTPPPTEGTDFVFFQGEPIKVELEIFNEGSKKAVVLAHETTPENTFDMVVLKAPTPKMKTTLRLEVSPTAKLKNTSGETSAKWSEQIALPSQSGLQFRATVHNGQENLPTGVYKLKFRPLLRSASGNQIPANNDTFSFEIRSINSLGDRLDVLRRQAARLSTEGKYQEADKKLNELLLLYPNSVSGYLEKGLIAQTLKKKDEALAAYRKALDLLRSGADTIYSSYASRVTIEEVIGTLTATLQALQKPQ